MGIMQVGRGAGGRFPSCQLDLASWKTPGAFLYFGSDARFLSTTVIFPAGKPEETPLFHAKLSAGGQPHTPQVQILHPHSQ